MDRDDADRLARALRAELWSTPGDDLLARLTDRGGMNAGLNPPEETEDAEPAELVWRAVRSAGLADE